MLYRLSSASVSLDLKALYKSVVVIIMANTQLSVPAVEFDPHNSRPVGHCQVQSSTTERKMQCKICTQ